MRKLAWAALGFAAAAGLAEYVLSVEELPFFAAALAVLALSAPLLKNRVRRGQALALCLSAALGFLSWWGYYTYRVLPCEALVGQNITLTATVRDYVERHPDYERVEIRVLEGGPKVKGLLYLYDGTMPELEPGDIIRAEIRVSSAVTRQGERSRIYTSQGHLLLGYIREDGLAVTGRMDRPWLYFPQRLSHAVQALCDELFDEDTAPFVKGLLTGNTDQLEEDTENYTAMRTAGVMHIVAVSGMHMFVLVAFLQLLLGKSRRTSILCLPLIALFALMAGGKPSVVRAAVMQAMVLLAPVAGREADGRTCLGAALLVLLLADPMAIGGVGLQLSFSCMAGLVFLLPRMMQWMGERLPKQNRMAAYAAGNLACTVCATVFSAPLAALYFGQMPLFSLAANLLTLWAVELIFAGGYVSCALGALWPAAGGAMAWALSWAVRACMLVYRTLAQIPFASLDMTSGRNLLWLAGAYGIGAAWFVLRKRGRHIRLDVPLCLVLMGLGAVLLQGKLTIRRGEGLVSVLDVGQGECVVLADSEGAVVVDCGGSALSSAGDVAANYLLSIGKTRIDALVLTHLHADHANGVETLLYRTDVGCLVMPADGDDSDWQREDILQAAERENVPVHLIGEKTHLQAGGIGLDLLLPEGEQDTNERGIVALASMGDMRTLIMGDAGREAEMSLLAERAIPDVDILVVGHHGSRSASGPVFLRAAKAETAVASVGYNTYGHPAPDVLERLEYYCEDVLRTDEQGNVVIRVGGEELGETG